MQVCCKPGGFKTPFRSVGAKMPCQLVTTSELWYKCAVATGFDFFEARDFSEVPICVSKLGRIENAFISDRANQIGTDFRNDQSQAVHVMQLIVPGFAQSGKCYFAHLAVPGIAKCSRLFWVAIADFFEAHIWVRVCLLKTQMPRSHWFLIASDIPESVTYPRHATGALVSVKRGLSVLTCILALTTVVDDDDPGRRACAESVSAGYSYVTGVQSESDALSIDRQVDLDDGNGNGNDSGMYT